MAQTVSELDFSGKDLDIRWEGVAEDFWGDLKTQTKLSFKKLLETTMSIELQDLIGARRWAKRSWNLCSAHDPSAQQRSVMSPGCSIDRCKSFTPASRTAAWRVEPFKWLWSMGTRASGMPWTSAPPTLLGPQTAQCCQPLPKEVSTPSDGSNQSHLCRRFLRHGCSGFSAVEAEVDADCTQSGSVFGRRFGISAGGLHGGAKSGWRCLRTTNIIERVFREVRRRTRPMSCFQNLASVERILFALFYRFNRLWSSKPLIQITQKS